VGQSTRRDAKAKIAKLLEHWHLIEVWLKRAEQINAETIIPAINELRYASRQLYLATQIYGKSKISEIDQKHLQKRMILAEQYLLNAEHDVVDAVVGFFRKEIKRIDESITRPAMIQYFNDYPNLCRAVEECETLIIETRQDYEKRKENYDKVRKTYFDVLAAQHGQMILSETNARYKISDLERQVEVLERAKGFREAFTLFAEVLGVLSVVYSIRIAYLSGIWWPF
jgi:vacuolar-type H+-ATPase catalytic subunit A/Vma1